MKLPHMLLLTGIILMVAAFVIPKLFGGRAALRGELERELASSGELHMAAAHSHDESASAAADAHAAEADLARRVNAALHRGQGTASVLKWLGIGVAIAGVVMLVVNNTQTKGS